MATYSNAQLANVRQIIAIGKQRKMSERDIVTALSVALVESKFKNYANPNVPESLAIPHDDVSSDHDSVGVFQQRVMYWGTAAELMSLPTAANKFFDALAAVGNRATMSIGQAAQTVQKSAYPDRYNENLPEAQRLYKTVTGGGEPGLDVDAYDEYKEQNPGTAPNPLAWLQNPDNWQRIGFFALGAFLVIFCVYVVLAESPAAKAAVKVAIK